MVKITIFLGILFLALILFILPLRGHESDIRDFTDWSKSTTLYGIWNIYSGDSLATHSIYPPVILYGLNFMGMIYQHFSPTFDLQTGLIVAMIKIPTLIFHLLISYLIFSYVKKFNLKMAIFSSGLFLFNPAVILYEYFWAEPDTIHTFFLVGSILLIINNKLGLAASSYTLAALSKPQVWVLLPFIYLTIYLKNRKKVLTAILISVFTFFIVSLPFILSGNFLKYLTVFFTAFGILPNLTNGAMNIWGFIQLGKKEYISDFNLILGTVSPYIMGMLLLLGSYIAASLKLLKSFKNESSLILLFSFLTFAFFMLPTRIHINHIFFSLPLLCLLFYKFRWSLVIYFAISAAFLLNISSNQILRFIASLIYLMSFTYLIIKIVQLPGRTSELIKSIKYTKLPGIFYYIWTVFLIIIILGLVFKSVLLSFGNDTVIYILTNWGSHSGVMFYTNLLNKMYNQVLLLFLIGFLLLSIIFVVNFIFKRK